MNTENTTEQVDPIQAKKDEIVHYQGCLDRYGPGRWANAGRRHMDELKEELKVLEEALIQKDSTTQDAPPVPCTIKSASP